MTYEHTAVFDHPVEDVFAWHARPGALARLLPPWQPVRAVKETESLRDGEAILGLPAGLKWRARHDPAGYEDGRRFTDVLTTPGLATALGWRHTHSFSADPTGGCRVTDTVDSRVPKRLMEEMFVYRTRQLHDDLEAHRLWRAPDGRPLAIAVTGSSGLVGTALTALLTTGGHKVIRLQRHGASGTDRIWRPDDPDESLLEGVDAVVHLAGASIAGPFTSKHKASVRSSRVEPTRRLAELAARAGVGVFVSASAIGFYGPDRGDEQLSEDSGRGEGFLADLVADWEEAAGHAASSGVRVVTVRTGIVQSPRGGTLRLFRPLFATGLGGPLSGGQAWMSWIGIDDLVDIYLRALVDLHLDGPVNATAPEPVRNEDFTAVLGRVLRRPTVLPVPSLGPRLLLGREGAAELALASQRVLPSKLIESGHRFRHPNLEPALRHVLGRTRGA
ncbi:MAG TPA: TIGR01777 family oxidoreductase [Acidimicrobiales bacterium]|nr:TIGR01777 family oxidoreductase [Acidimicrobiales bacterium]